MTSRERLKALVAKQPVDQICQTAWWHLPMVDNNVTDFVKATIDFTENNSFDFVKMMYNTLFFAQNFGVNVEYSHNPLDWKPTALNASCLHPSEFKTLTITPPTQGNLGRQLEATKRVVDHFQGKVPVIGTTFTDLSFYKDMITFFNNSCVPLAIKYYPNDLHDALKRINETNVQWIEALAKIGVDGMFIASHFATNDCLNDEQFEEFCRPYDMVLCETANNNLWFNMLHIHGTGRLSFNRFLEYPVQAYSWEDIYGAPDCVSFSQAAKMTDKIFIGGIEMWNDYKDPTYDRDKIKARLKQRCYDAINAVGKDRFIFAPGCGAPLDIPPFVFSLQAEVVKEITAELQAKSHL